MKHMTKRMLSLLLAIITVFSLGAVAFADTTTFANSITLSKTELSLYEGKSETLTATTQPNDYNGGVTWSSSDSTVATVTNDGKVTAIKAGSATITATPVSSDDTISASCQVTVTTDSISSFSIEGKTEISGKGTTTLTAYTTYASGTKVAGAHTWYSSDTNVATVSSAGVVTAKKPGSVTITAERVNGGSSATDKATTTVTITVVPVQSLTISGNGLSSNTASMPLGSTLQLTAEKNPSNTFDTSDIIWASSDSTVATVTNGKVTAIAEGETTITATLGDTSTTASVTIYVTKKFATSATISATTLTMYPNGTSTLKVTVLPTDAQYNVIWESDNASVVQVDNNGQNSTTLTALAKGTAIIKATINDGSTDPKTVSCKVTVTDPTADITATAKVGTNVSTIYSSLRNEFKNIYGTYPATGTKIAFGTVPSSTVGTLYTRSSTSATYAVKATTYTFSDLSGMTFVPKARGTYDLAYTLTSGNNTMSGYITITVSSVSKDIYIELDGTDAYTFSSRSADGDTAKTIISDAIGTYGSIEFGYISNSTVGYLYTSSSSTSSSYRVANGDVVRYASIGSLCFRPNKIGTWEIEYTAYSGSNATGDVVAQGTLYIVVGNGGDTITINLDDDSPYEFSENTKKDKTSAAEAIEDAVYEDYGSNYSYLIFDTVSTSSSAVGTLFADSDETAIKTTTKYYRTGSSLSNYYVDDLYFVPKKNGTYSRDFTAYSSTGKEIFTGTLELVVGNGGNTITVNLDDDDPYEFSDDTKKDKTSAAEAIEDAVYEDYGSNYSYLIFDTVSTSSSAVGTLFADSDETAIKTTTKYYRTGSSLSNYYVDDLYFVPKKNGTYSRDFTAYSSTGKEIYSGTLELVVGNGGASSDIDIYFNTTTGSTITFGEDVFEDWFQAQKGSSYKLAYVTFDDYEEDYGTFKHSTSTFTPGNDVNYYTDGYTGSTGTSAKYLKNVKFTAESSYGFEAVDFTCYGGTTASKANVSASGTLYIYATKGSVKNITYTVKYGSAQDLDEDDFLDTYKTAMSTTSSTAKYYIQLLETPAKGTLYYNYTSSTKPGTKITTSNFDDYEFYVNGSSLYDSVEDLTYIPAASLTGTGSTSVRYLAYSTSGDPLYVGTIVFDYGTASTSMTCASDGYTFKLTDFYSATDSDRVVSLTFKQPTSGALYLNAKNGSGTLLTSTTKLYTISSASGSYPITALTYIPKAGASGNVSISYTATTASGKSSSGTVTIAVTSKTASSQFTDVTASGVGSWAADAVDFAYKWGLVNGTGTYTFDPNGTMSRAMMVAVLYRAAGSPTVTGSCPFKDVSSSAYYYDAVIWANKNGIVTGTSSTTFNPDGAVTREQVATFLYRYAKYKGTSTTNTGSLSAYTDQSNVSSYAKDAMTWAVTNGYITSTSTTAKVLTPAGNASRAQVAVMLHRFLTY